MLKRGTIALAGLVAVMLGFGCRTSGHDIIGTWDIKGGPGPATLEFQANGNFNTKASMPGRSSSSSGQYTVSGDTVTFSTMQKRSATVKWNTADEFVMTGDDGQAMTFRRKK